MEYLFRIPVKTALIILIIGYNSCTPDLPTVTTSGVTDINEVSAVSGGNVIDDGGSEVSARGICWNTADNPSTEDNTTLDGSGAGTFTSNLTQLSPNTKYYLRAYATNRVGTGYGEKLSFTTSAIKDLYVIEIQNDTEWDCLVIGKGGETFYLKTENSLLSIVYYKPLPNEDGYPVFFDNEGIPSKIIIDDYIFLFGNYRQTLVDIAVASPNGEIMVYRDIQANYDLTLGQTKSYYTSNDLSDFIRIGARSLSTVGCAVGIITVETGVGAALAAVSCGSLFLNLVADLKPANYQVLGLSASTIGTIGTVINCGSLNIPSCIVGTASAGMSYSAGELVKIEERKEQVEVATGQLKTNLIVKTSEVTDFTENSATIGGVVTPDKVALVMERGVYYGTSHNPELTGIKFEIGSGIGLFSSNVSGLIPNTKYYVRAYAKNNAGPAFGGEVSFITLSNSGVIPTEGLVAYYPFNGNANDESVNNNHGTPYGVTPTSDRHGNTNSAYLFDGIDDYIIINHSASLNISQQISISLWLRPASSGPYYYPYHIIEKGTYWGFGQRRFDLNCSVTTTNGEFGFWNNLNLETGRFYHYVVIYNGSKLNTYVDGVLNGSFDANGLILTNQNDVYIGKYYLRNGYEFEGTLDDLRIYNRALTQQEISALYNE
jgi:hypothetical protein